MADQPIPFLYNPRAGRGSAVRHVDAVVAGFAAKGIAVVAQASTAAGDIEAVAEQLSRQGETRLVLGGGDGSVHEAVNGLMKSGQPAALGLVPLGSGNDFAKTNGIPLQIDAAVDELAMRMRDGTAPRAVDVGKCNERYFANGVGIGFDAKISAIASSIRLPVGRFVYPLAVVRGLVSGIVTPRVQLEFDGQHFEGQLTLASFNIGQWVGGMFHIAPTALNDDGLLDLVYVNALTRVQVVPLVPKLLRGEHLVDPNVHHQLVRHCQVTAEVDLPAHLDGENQEPRRDFAISILPGALQIL